jgi:phenylacetate-CoA ligase
LNESTTSSGSSVEFSYLLSQVWGEPRDLKSNRDEMVARRDERVRSIVRFAFERVPWYGRVMLERGLVPEDFTTADDLSLLPIIRHEDLASDPEAFLPRGARIEEFLELKTSGSTMVPRKIYYDSEGMVAAWAVKLRERAARERYIGSARYRSAFLSLDGNPTLVREYFRTIVPAVWKLIPEERLFSVLEDSPRVVEGMREWRPRYLGGYGSALGRLFRYLAESGDSMPLPDVITFGSDALAPAERRLIEEDFGVPVLGIYGATEAFSIGFECGEDEGYHVHEDVTVVRIVDPEGRSVAPGVPGAVLVSSLVSRGTVLLNYRLGDVGSPVAGPCPCGRALPRIRLLEGRSATWVERGGELPIHQYRLFRSLASTGISRWQVVQRDLSRFAVRVIPAPGQERSQVESDVRAAMRDLIGPGRDISIEFPVDLERTRSGKVLSFIRAGV